MDHVEALMTTLTACTGQTTTLALPVNPARFEHPFHSADFGEPCIVGCSGWPAESTPDCIRTVCRADREQYRWEHRDVDRGCTQGDCGSRT